MALGKCGLWTTLVGALAPVVGRSESLGPLTDIASRRRSIGIITWMICLQPLAASSSAFRSHMRIVYAVNLIYGRKCCGPGLIKVDVDSAFRRVPARAQMGCGGGFLGGRRGL